MSFFKKILKIIAIVIAIIAIVYAIAALLTYLGAVGQAGAWSSFLSGGVSWYTANYAIAAFGLAVLSALISPEGFREVVEPIVQASGEVAEAVVGAAVNVASGALSGVAKNLKWVWLLGAGYLILRSNNDSEDSERYVPSSTRNGEGQTGEVI